MCVRRALISGRNCDEGRKVSRGKRNWRKERGPRDRERERERERERDIRSEGKTIALYVCVVLRPLLIVTRQWILM